ncbi:MAG: hypothetical protein KAG37_07765 [Flavobacteriales bacterium]|nr:hypothetical protein [Flavobacteriales bacterium]
MDIQLEKYMLMEWLIGLKDETIISRIKSIKEGNTSINEWGDDVSETEISLIKAGIKDVQEGNVHTHEEVMREINEIYNIS